LEDLHERLAGVIIECLPYGELIRRYDRAGTLFYIDPPYWGSETDYGNGLFGRDDFAKLADQLARLKGRFVLTINDLPATRELFARFTCKRVCRRAIRSPRTGVRREPSNWWLKAHRQGFDGR
jgi:DNA adenine methylase